MTGMKKCELCKAQARAYCESDQASLCWDCDAMVHGANFLVARHSRTLLCRACQSQTPWKASGSRLGHTVSLCERCVRNKEENRESQGGNGEDDENADDPDVDDDDDDDDDDANDADDDGDTYADEDADEEKEGDNQVVPWSMTPPPPAASSSSSEEYSMKDSSLKRMRQNHLDLQSRQEEDLSRSLDRTALKAQEGYGKATSSDSLRPRKERKTEPDHPVYVDEGSASSSAIFQPRRFLQCEGSVAVDLNTSDSRTRSL